MTEFLTAAALIGVMVWFAPYLIMGIAMWGFSRGVHCPVSAGGDAGNGENREHYYNRMITRGLIAGGWVLIAGAPFVLATV